MEDLNTHPGGQQLLALFQAETTKRSSLAGLQTVQQLLQKYHQLIKKQ
ncbi:MAG: hypothetical protein GQ581_10360 [Methyloprofundus sp.]|nr:hypothetical protein [Methyloprofundus sp.]